MKNRSRPTAYTLNAQDNTATIQFTKEFMDSLTVGTYNFVIRTLVDSYNVYITKKAAGTDWIIKDTWATAIKDGSYLDMTFKEFNNTIADGPGRAYSTRKLDLTKPIFIEYDLKSVEKDWWQCFILADHLYELETAREADTTAGRVQIH